MAETVRMWRDRSGRLHESPRARAEANLYSAVIDTYKKNESRTWLGQAVRRQGDRPDPTTELMMKLLEPVVVSHWIQNMTNQMEAMVSDYRVDCTDEDDRAPVPSPEILLQRVKDALGTDEDGDALVEVAAAAHQAEQILAAINREPQS